MRAESGRFPGEKKKAGGSYRAAGTAHQIQAIRADADPGTAGLSDGARFDMRRILGKPPRLVNN